MCEAKNESYPGSIAWAELHKLADFVKTRYGVEVVAFEKDLCKDNSCAEIFEVVSRLGLQVNMLFNNAGIGSTGSFGNGSVEGYEKQIKLNVLATTVMTRMFLDMLKRNSPSYILNVGSLASFFPLPKKQVYGATKSFIYYFSRCLRAELKKDKVYVSLLCPGAMNTNENVRLVVQNSNYLLRHSVLDPEKVAPPVIDGLFRQKKLIIPGKLNKGYVLLYSILPGFVKTIITNRSMKRLDSQAGVSDFSRKPLAY